MRTEIDIADIADEIVAFADASDRMDALPVGYSMARTVTNAEDAYNAALLALGRRVAGLVFEKEIR